MNIKKTVFGVALVAGLALASVSARAESFSMTNVLNPTDSVVSWPTNTIGTNGVGGATGGAISIENYREGGLYISGMNAGATSAVVTVRLVRGVDRGKPSVTSTNLGWERVESSPLSISLATPVQAGPFTVVTNIDSSFLIPGKWLGIYVATNNTAGTSITNFDCGFIKKVVPLRWP